MKNIIITLLLLTGTVLASPKEATTIDVSRIIDFQKILSSRHEFVFFVPAGTALKLSMNLDGDLAKAGFAPATLSFERDLYFYAPDQDSQQPLFSWDGLTWRPLTDMVSGSVGLGLEGDNQNLNLQLVVQSKKS